MTDLTFSPERSARGEPVQFCKTGGIWVDVHYVGPDRVRGGHFVQFPDGDSLSTSALRMKPMPTKKWLLEFDSEEQAKAAVNTLFVTNRFAQAGYEIPPIKEVEIPAEDV